MVIVRGGGGRKCEDKDIDITLGFAWTLGVDIWYILSIKCVRPVRIRILSMYSTGGKGRVAAKKTGW